MSLQPVYRRLPPLLQNAACSLYGLKEARIRFGREFRRRLEELSVSERWSRGEITNYQSEQLQRLVRHAYESVPYYRELMNRLKLRPSDIRSLDDLPKLPILTKEEVRANCERLVSQRARRRELIARHTSGTTAKALRFYSTARGIAFQWAVWWRHRRRFGVEPGTWHVNFTGKPVVPPDQASPPYWRWNMHHLTPDKVAPIHDFFERHPVTFYSGYPSVIHAYVVAARAAGLSASRPPRFVFTGAENMLDFQARDIVGFLGATLTDQYGTSEGCGNASQCPELVYHEDFEFGILERVDAESAGGGRTRGQIVCTGFATPEFPLIRYAIGDSATWERSDHRCRCGRQSAVIARIEGRLEDYVVTPEGRRIMRFDYVFKETDNVEEAQVVQRQLGEVVVRVVRRPAYNVHDEEHIARAIHELVSPGLAVQFEYVAEIERTPNGKFPAVKSLLAQSPGAPELRA
jgi:phenylacetate-CoA ligase